MRYSFSISVLGFINDDVAVFVLLFQLIARNLNEQLKINQYKSYV